jgi:sulfur transfer protein SufE
MLHIACQTHMHDFFQLLGLNAHLTQSAQTTLHVFGKNVKTHASQAHVE